MAKICILSALLLLLLYTSVQGQNSPCPDILTYIKEPGSDKTIGQIEIRNPPRNNSELHLRVDIKYNPRVLRYRSYAGELRLASQKSEQDVARDILEGRPLLYHIYFPVQNPLPTMHRIWFNNEKICSSPEVSADFEIVITLEHFQVIIPSPQNQPNPLPQSRPAKQKRDVSLSPGIHNNIFLHPNKRMPTSQSSNNYNPSPQWSATPRNKNNYNHNIFLNQNAPRITPVPPIDNNFQPVVRTINPNGGRNPFLPLGPSQTPQPNSPVDNTGNYHECGMSSSSGRPNLLIVNGKKILPGQWPWLVAIYIIGNEYQYICSGTVLTTRHILTAGHCLKTPGTNETIPPNTLAVALGRYKLLDFNEEGSVTREVARHISHPEYTHSLTGDSDLAVLILKSPVEFTALIRPICLRSISVNPHRLEERNGIVVGWGADEYGNPYTEEPRMVNMPIVTAEVCLRSNHQFSRITSERTFCAGWRQHSGPCNGDSGSGLMILDSSTGRYQLRGIVSRSLFDNQLICDQREYVVFVDVFKYLLWINQQISFT